MIKLFNRIIFIFKEMRELDDMVFNEMLKQQFGVKLKKIKK